MATKRFKALPKDSQRAAFAQMDKDGTRQRQSSGGSFLPREVIGGYRIARGQGSSGQLARVVSPSGKIGIAQELGRSNQRIISEMKKANKSFV